MIQRRRSRSTTPRAIPADHVGDRRVIDGARDTLDIANPYVADRGMIRRIADAARARRQRAPLRAGQRQQLGVRGGAAVPPRDAPRLPACASSSIRRCSTPRRSWRDGEEVLLGTCNLEAWSLKRFFEIDIRVRSRGLAAQFEERFAAPAEQLSSDGRRLTGAKQRAKATVFAAISPLL